MNQIRRNRPIYTVTIIRTLANFTDFSFVNFFYNSNKAEDCLYKNKEFFIDNNYEFAVIEEIFEGKLKEAKVVQWYRFKQNYTLKIEKSSVSLKKIKLQKQFNRCYAFCGEGII